MKNRVTASDLERHRRAAQMDYETWLSGQLAALTPEYRTRMATLQLAGYVFKRSPRRAYNWLVWAPDGEPAYAGMDIGNDLPTQIAIAHRHAEQNVEPPQGSNP